MSGALRAPALAHRAPTTHTSDRGYNNSSIIAVPASARTLSGAQFEVGHAALLGPPNRRIAKAGLREASEKQEGPRRQHAQIGRL